MSHKPDATRLPRIDPRATRSREAILAAAARVLTRHGVASVTHQLVAAEAGVGRATVYRHWPTPLDLLLETLETAMPVLDLGDGDIRTQLLTELGHRIRWFNQPIAHAAVAAMIARADHEPRFRALRHRAFGVTTELLAEAIARAIGRGELRPETPSHMLAKNLIGTLLFERHLLGNDLTMPMLEQIVDTVLAGWLIRSDRPD